MKRQVTIASFALLLLIMFSTLIAEAQPPPPTIIPGAKAIEVDLEKHTISGELPFDKPFYLTGKIPEKSNVARLEFEIGKYKKKATQFFSISNTITGKNSFFLLFNKSAFDCEFLLPDRNYIFRICAYDKDGNELQDFGFTYGITTNTKTGDRTKLDFGIGYAPRPRALIGFTTVNFYFTAVNDDTDLQEITNFRRNIFIRTAIFAGVSPITFSSSTDQPIKGNIGVGSFIYGISIRSPLYGSFMPWTFRSKIGQELLQPMRIVIGEMLFKQADPNPIVTKDRNKAALYFGLSYDLNISSILGPLGKIISK